MEVYYLNDLNNLNILDIIISPSKKQLFCSKSFIFQTFFQLLSCGYFCFGLYINLPRVTQVDPLVTKLSSLGMQMGLAKSENNNASSIFNKTTELPST